MQREYDRELLAALRRFWSRVKPSFARWVGSFRYFPVYLKAAVKQWNAILFGEGIVAAAFLIAWAFWHPPLGLIFLVALLVAGFLVWVAEYVKSIPKFTVNEFILQQTDMFIGPANAAPIFKTQGLYIQLCPKCLNNAAVQGCEAYLIAVYLKRSDEKWQKTGANESSHLKWSACEERQITLEPKAETRLNVCHTNSSNPLLIPDVEFLHLRSQLLMPGTFSFDVKVVAKDCAPVFVSLEVTFESQQWDKPICRLRQGLTTDEPDSASIS